MAYDARMQWRSGFRSHPRFAQATRFVTGRPAWVLKATGLVAVLAFIVPVLAAGVLLIAAGLITAVAWTVFSTLGRLTDAITGQSKPADRGMHQGPQSDGRENVRVMHRH